MLNYTPKEESDLVNRVAGELVRALCPRKYANAYGCASPRKVAEILASGCVATRLHIDDQRQPENKVANNATIMAHALHRWRMPLRWVSPSLCEDLTRTRPPQITFGDLRFPLPAMTFLLPPNALKTKEGDMYAISIVRLDDGVFEPIVWPCDFAISTKEQVVVMGWTPGNCFSSALKLDEQIERTEDMEMLEYSFTDSSPLLDSDREVVARMTNLVTNLIAYLSQPVVVDSIETSTVCRSAKPSRGVDEMWTPIRLGQNHTKKSARHTTTSENPSDIRTHWRRGHWHTILWGEKKGKSRLAWIQPILVNAK